jgi:5-methylcytosine-specific restriction enzyme subunit McrC
VTVVRLTERRSREVRLPRAEVDFLLADPRKLIDVVPSFEKGLYRLTPRGVVGFFDGPSVRYAVRPKLPWPNLLHLLGVSAACGVATPSDDLLSALARALVHYLEAVSRAGLVAGYREADTVAGYLRGRLRTTDQLRDAASRAFPDTFHITESVFDLDTPWNRVPKAVASALLPHLPPDAAGELSHALAPFAGVSDGPVTDADFAAAEREPRAAGYAELLRLCRLLSAGPGAFLIDLGRAFENYVARALADVLPAKWSLDVQPCFPLGPLVLQPDLVLRRGAEAWAVLDAKWKRLAGGPEAADVHQVLAYAALTGARRVGLVYPGARWGRKTFAAAGVTVSLFRVQVVGPLAECAASVRKLARAARVCRPRG